MEDPIVLILRVAHAAVHDHRRLVRYAGPRPLSTASQVGHIRVPMRVADYEAYAQAQQDLDPLVLFDATYPDPRERSRDGHRTPRTTPRRTRIPAHDPATDPEPRE